MTATSDGWIPYLWISMYSWGLSTGSRAIVYSSPRAPVLLLYVALPGFPSISVSGPPPLWIFQYGTGSEDRRVCTCTKIHGWRGGGSPRVACNRSINSRSCQANETGPLSECFRKKKTAIDFSTASPECTNCGPHVSLFLSVVFFFFL